MKITLEVTEEQIIKALFENTEIMDRLAGQMFNKFCDSRWGDIDKKYTEIAKEQIREVISEYLKNYYEAQGIGKKVERQLESLTKDDIIKIISSKI